MDSSLSLSSRINCILIVIIAYALFCLVPLGEARFHCQQKAGSDNVSVLLTKCKTSQVSLSMTKGKVALKGLQISLILAGASFHAESLGAVRSITSTKPQRGTEKLSVKISADDLIVKTRTPKSILGRLEKYVTVLFF